MGERIVAQQRRYANVFDNFFQRHLQLFLIFIFFIIAAGSGGVKPLMERTTFVLAPEGRLVEQFTADPATRALAKALGDKSAEEVQLRDLLRAIEAAQKDEKIERMLLRVDQLQPTGYASLREVAAALAKFRASGKQIVAFGENLSQTQYLLAAQADEVYLDPMGSLMLEGLGRYRQYYREGLQDKLGVDVHLFKVGEYKSAAEPYVLDAASKEAKEAKRAAEAQAAAKAAEEAAETAPADSAEAAQAPAEPDAPEAETEAEPEAAAEGSAESAQAPAEEAARRALLHIRWTLRTLTRFCTTFRLNVSLIQKEFLCPILILISVLREGRKS